MELVFRLVFKTSSGRITPSVAGSIPAPSVFGKGIERVGKGWQGIARDRSGRERDGYA